MKITGIQNGAVLQRSIADNCCSVVLHASFFGTPQCTSGHLTPLGEGQWQLEGIPVGGPYTVTISDGAESVIYDEIYVGDVWLLAGQSNMEGAGRVRECDRSAAMSPIPAVRAYYMKDQWEPARPQLHQLWESADPAHKATFAAEREHRKNSPIKVSDFPPSEQIRGVGPGYFFAKAMHEMTGIPQGVLPCAVGGAPIHMWTVPQNGEDNYFTAAYRRIIACGSNLRGIFWYQGEGYNGSLDAYDAMFESMRGAYAALCGTEVLPCVLAQTFKCTLRYTLLSEENGRIWSRFRAHQWEMTKNLPMLAAVATNDLELDDCIHLSADAQEKLGIRAAETMQALLEGRGGEPEINELRIVPDTCVPSWMQLHIRYRNLRGKLISSGVPSGFSLSERDASPTAAQFQHTALCGDTVVLRLEMTLEELLRQRLWYAFGHTFYCNIMDEAGHAIPAIGPLPLAETAIMVVSTPT